MPTSKPASRTPRITPAQRRPMSGPGEERSVEQRRQSVVRQNRGARCFSDEAAAEDALDRAAGVIRPEAEEESGAGAVLFQQLDQARYPSSGCRGRYRRRL